MLLVVIPLPLRRSLADDVRLPEEALDAVVLRWLLVLSPDEIRDALALVGEVLLALLGTFELSLGLMQRVLIACLIVQVLLCLAFYDCVVYL